MNKERIALIQLIVDAVHCDHMGDVWDMLTRVSAMARLDEWPDDEDPDTGVPRRESFERWAIEQGVFNSLYGWEYERKEKQSKGGQG